MAFTYVWCRLCNNHYLKYTMPFLDKQESWQKMLFTRVFRAPISFAITRRPCFCLVLQTHFLIAIFYCGWNVLSAARPSTRTSCKACKSNVSTCNAIMSYGTSKKKRNFSTRGNSVYQIWGITKETSSSMEENSFPNFQVTFDESQGLNLFVKPSP